MAKVRAVRIELPYGKDPVGEGFYWPSSEQKRAEARTIKRNSPTIFESVYQCRPGAREGAVFLDADLKAFFATSVGGQHFPATELILGIGAPIVRAFVSRGHSVVQAWDTAFSTTTTSAWTVCATGLFVPCSLYHRGEDPTILGPCEFHYDVLLLDIFRRRLDFAGLVPAMRSQAVLWNPQEIVIEKKASGIDAIAALKSSGLPIIATEPREGKRERAINSIGLKGAGSVQGWCRQHRVLTPVMASWLEKWRTEMKDFSGDEETSSDQVDATVHLVQRAIIAGSSGIILPADWIPERSAIPGHMIDSNNPPMNLDVMNDPRAVLMTTIGALPDLSEDPYWGTCARCIHKNDQMFCPIQGRKMLAMDSCEEFSDTPIPDFNAAISVFRGR